MDSKGTGPIEERLRKKGWGGAEIKDTVRKMNDPAVQQKHEDIKGDMHRATYWLILLVLTIGNFFVSLVLVPFMLVLRPAQVEIIVAVLGLVLGVLFSNLIFSLEHLEPGHHLAAAIFMPIVAIVNVFIVVQVANTAAARIGLPGHENPYLVSVLYAVAFFLPYANAHIRNWRRNRRQAA